MDARLRLAFLVGLTTWIGGTLNCDLSLAQFARPRSQQVDSTWMPPSREVLTLLEEARGHVAASRWSEATLAIGQLLGIDSDSSNEEFGIDYFLESNTAPNPPRDPRFGRITQGNLFAILYELVDQLPDEAMDILDVRHGVEAKKALDDAVALGDWDRIERLSTRLGFLPVGQDATLLVAQRALGQGDASKGAFMLSQLLKQRRALARFGAALGILGAEAQLLAGDREEAERLLRLVAAQNTSYRVDWFGQALNWDAATLDNDISKILEKLSAKVTSQSLKKMDRVVSQPSLVGGNTRRNSDTRAGVPLPILQWHAELHESSQQKEELLSTLKGQAGMPIEQAGTTIPSRMPISVGRSIITSTFDQRIVALDLQTGLLQWECVYTGMPLGFSMENIPTRGSIGSEYGVPEYLAKRVWGEATIGHLASDGERVYGVSELPSVDVSEAYALGPNARFARQLGIKTYNVLQCWSVPEEGKLLWEVGGVKSETEPALVNILFLGPPLPYRGELLILGELNGEVALFSLAPDSGKVLWRQPLVVNNGAVIANDTMRRSIGATPSADGNLIVCPTLSGHLVAFDLHTRSLQWGLAYRSKVSTAGAMTGTFGGMELGVFEPFDSRSVDLAPLIAEGVALYAPPDGFGVYAIELQTGERRWHALDSQDRKIRYVGCVAEQTAIIVCQNAVYGLDLQTGEPKWEPIGLPEGAQVVGRGLRNGSRFYIPTSAQTIEGLDIVTGKWVSSTRLEQMPGNLVNVNNKLLSLTPTELDCYSIQDLLREEVKQELAQASISLDSLMKRGELALADGRVEEAMDLLEKAYQMDPQDQDVWLRLRKASTTALMNDFEKYSSRVSAYKIGLEFDFVFLRTLVQGLQQKGLYDQVLLKLIELSDARTSRRHDQSGGNEFFQPTPLLSVQEDRWIETQVERALKEIGDWQSKPDLVAALESQVAKIPKLQPNLQRVKLKHFRSVALVSKVRVRLAEELLEEGNLLDAEELAIEAFASEPIANWIQIDSGAAEVLAKVYAASFRMDLVEKILPSASTDEVTQVRARVEEWYRIWAERGNEVYPQAIANRFFNAIPTNEWPKGKVEGNVNASQEMMQLQGFADSTLPCRVQGVVGETLQNWDFTYSTSSGNVILRNRLNGFSSAARTQSFTLAQGVVQAFAIDGKLILENNRTLVAVDALKRPAIDSENEIWHRYFEGSVPVVERGRARQVVEATYWGLPVANKSFRVIGGGRFGLLVIDEDQLMCLDPKTGDTIWKQVGFQGAHFALDGNVLYGALPTRKLLKMDVRSGQTLASENFSGAHPYTLAVGKHLLYANEQKRQVTLVDPKDGATVLDRTFSADTAIALAPNGLGLVTLDNAGTIFYWNFQSGKEHQHRIEKQDDLLDLRDSFDAKGTTLSVHPFEDKLIVLPYNKMYTYARPEIYPSEGDSAFARVSGSVFAIDASDGKPVWEKAVPVMQYGFPLHQSKNNCPGLFFVRRIVLPRVNDGRAAEMVCVAVVDVRTGKILFEQDDVVGAHQPQFSQTVVPELRMVRCTYGGVEFMFKWTDQEHELSPDRIGQKNMSEYAAKVEEMLKSRKEEKRVPAPRIEVQPVPKP
ncbi:PQQ-binding-like beta-propeller repeat protein [Pirellulaceae bacterium SH467]